MQVIKIRLKKSDLAVAHAFGNRFCIPLKFELLTHHSPFCQSALGDRLSYELSFQSYGEVIVSSDTDASYRISGISLEFEIVTHPDLARLVKGQYESKLPIYYDWIIRHSIILKNKSDTLWNFNTPERSLKGILLIFIDPYNPYERNSEEFYNPKIKHVSCNTEGKPNQVYASGMNPYQQFEEICKYFGGSQVAKDFHHFDVRLEDYLVDKFALWLDLRSTDDTKLHGSGRVIENGSDGITLQIVS